MKNKFSKSLIFALSVVGSFGAYADCVFEVLVGDNLVFDIQSMEVDGNCKSVSVNLIHTGNLPANIMGHNWVLSKASDLSAIANDGFSAGLDNNYLKPGDERIIAATKVIGGGDEASVEFSIEGLSSDESYQFFCSFPGHWAVMKGSFVVK